MTAEHETKMFEDYGSTMITDSSEMTLLLEYEQIRRRSTFKKD